MSLYLGADIDRKSRICSKCKEPMDIKGYHGLHCKWGSHVIRRHNALRDELNKMMNKAGKDTRIEQKYIINEKDDKWYEMPGIPGDLVVEDWCHSEAKEHYMDVVVGNICAPTMVDKAKLDRLAIAKIKEQTKRNKYQNISNFIQLAIETKELVHLY